MGIRVVIETIYEPKQDNTYSAINFKDDSNISTVNMVAESLQLQPVGWIYTSRNKDCYMSPEETIQAARLQNQHLEEHQIGYKVPKFVTVVLHEYKPEDPTSSETYMVSDQFANVVRDDVVALEQTNKKMIQFKNNREDNSVPPILNEGKAVTEVDSAFFMVNVNHGVPKYASKYAYIKNNDFPVENRMTKQTNGDLKKYLQRWKKKGRDCYANLHLLLFLLKEIDLESVMKLGKYATDKSYNDEDIQNLEMIVDMVQNYN